MSAKKPDSDRLDRVVAEAHHYRDQREKDYRVQALKLYPWVCGRCGREFDRSNLSELTVHHRDHDHDNNPSDGSNWELLCLYCHDNEHQRQLEAALGGGSVGQEGSSGGASHNPFADLKSLLDDSKK